MINLAATTDKLEVITGQAVTVDVHASYVEIGSTFAVTAAGKKNTAISTATTTDISGSPAASSTRNVTGVAIRNKHASSSVDITVQFNQNGTLFEIVKLTLAAGETLQYSEDIGWYKVPNLVSVPAPNVSTADQAIGASVTNYITNSDLHVSAGRPLRVGTVMRWHICFAKTAAGTVSMTFDMRGGTLGTTGDASRANLATGTQTAVADNGELEVACTVRSISATGTVNTSMQMEHNFAATGLGPTNVVTSDSTSGTFDTTSTALIFGMSLTTGASHAITVTRCVAEFVAGTI